MRSIFQLHLSGWWELPLAYTSAHCGTALYPSWLMPGSLLALAPSSSSWNHNNLKFYLPFQLLILLLSFFWIFVGCRNGNQDSPSPTSPPPDLWRQLGRAARWEPSVELGRQERLGYGGGFEVVTCWLEGRSTWETSAGLGGLGTTVALTALFISDWPRLPLSWMLREWRLLRPFVSCSTTPEMKAFVKNWCTKHLSSIDALDICLSE